MRIIFFISLISSLALADTNADHHYVLKEGYEYGYINAISPEEAQKGRKSQEVVMFRYAGVRDGNYQVLTKEGQTLSILQCANPCEFIKSMYSYSDGTKETQRIVATPGTLAMGVLTDAIQGKLETLVVKRDGKKYNVWYDPKQGIIKLPLAGK